MGIGSGKPLTIKQYDANTMQDFKQRVILAIGILAPLLDDNIQENKLSLPEEYVKSVNALVQKKALDINLINSTMIVLFESVELSSHECHKTLVDLINDNVVGHIDLIIVLLKILLAKIKKRNLSEEEKNNLNKNVVPLVTYFPIGVSDTIEAIRNIFLIKSEIDSFKF